MTLSLIVAMTEDRVIGINNRLPWHLSEDLKRFKKITMGHPIIMGRKTFESIGKPLPGRENIVITENKAYRAEGTTVVHSLEDALKAGGASSGEKFVIGGARLFEAGLKMADKIYLTLIHGSYKGDVYFPKLDFEKDLKIVNREEGVGAPPDSISYSFIDAEIRK